MESLSQDRSVGADGRQVRALTAVLAAQFVAFGLVLGVQGVIWAEVMRRLALGAGLFGTLQLALPLVGLVVLLFNAKLYTHLGNRLQSFLSLGLLGAGMLVVAATASVPGFLVALALSGLGFAALDAASSSATMDLEQATGRHAMNVMHGLQSAAVMVGALVSGLALAAGWSYAAVAVVAAAACCVPVMAATLPAPYPRAGGAEEDPDLPDGDLRRDPRFLALAGICFLGSAAEAIAVVWTVIYLRDLGASLAVSGLALALFNGAMLVGRFVNAPLVARAGARPSLVISGVGIVAAVVPLLLSASIPVAIGSFTLLGLAVAGVQPTALSAAAPLSSNSGAATAGIMMSAYAALLVAPLAYGWLAEASSLRPAMVAVAALGAVATWLALSVRRDGHPRSGATAAPSA